MVKFDFKEWLKQEMTSCASVGGGGTFSSEIARLSRPLFSGMVSRDWADEDKPKRKKSKKKKDD